MYKIERAFAKHPEKNEYPKISMIWKSIPSQLTREIKSLCIRHLRTVQERVNMRIPLGQAVEHEFFPRLKNFAPLRIVGELSKLRFLMLLKILTKNS